MTSKKEDVFIANPQHSSQGFSRRRFITGGSTLFASALLSKFTFGAHSVTNAFDRKSGASAQHLGLAFIKKCRRHPSYARLARKQPSGLRKLFDIFSGIISAAGSNIQRTQIFSAKAAGAGYKCRDINTGQDFAGIAVVPDHRLPLPKRHP